MEQIFQLALISVEGTVDAFNDTDGIWWLSCKYFNASFLLTFGWRIWMMALERGRLCSANVSWWSFSICFCFANWWILLMMLTFYYFRMWCHLGSGVVWGQQTSLQFCWWADDHPCQMLFRRFCHPNEAINGAGNLMKMQT